MMKYRYLSKRWKAEEELDGLVRRESSFRNTWEPDHVWLEKRKGQYIVRYYLSNIKISQKGKWKLEFMEPDQIILRRKVTWDLIFMGVTCIPTGLLMTICEIASLTGGNISGTGFFVFLMGLLLLLLFWWLYLKRPNSQVRKFFEKETTFKAISDK